jgi:hypothetical protein
MHDKNSWTSANCLGTLWLGNNVRFCFWAMTS